MRSPAIALALLVLVPLIGAAPAKAQRETTSELLGLYVRQRVLTLAETDVRRSGGRMVLRPTEPLPVRSDSLWAWLESLKPVPSMANMGPEQIELRSVFLVEHLRRPVYDALFDSTRWAFVGSNARSGLDTLRTRELRARMEGAFGPPTRTLAELGSIEELPREDVIQFEYWFVVNDSIPVMVLDVNGPWDRGLVVAASDDMRDRLRDLKQALLGQLIDNPIRKAFVDYYYNVPQQTWYVSGFDGAMFFDRRIGRPNLALGRPSILPFLQQE